MNKFIAAVSSLLIVFLMLFLSACDNGLVAQVKSIRAAAGLPVVSTDEVSSISTTTAIGSGNITSDGGISVTARGVCWGTDPNPTIDDNYNEDGDVDLGSYSCSMTELSPGTIYYVRAYATNSLTTGYGSQVSFTTTSLDAPDSPDGLRVDNLTDSPEMFTQLKISWDAVVSADQGYMVCRDGLLSGNYDTTFNHTPADNSGTIEYIDTTVVPGDSYYYKVRAVNSAGLSSLDDCDAKVGVLSGEPVTGITLSSESLILTKLSDATIVATVDPADASIQTLLWESDSPETVSVDENGIITAVDYGRATISARSSDNTGITKSCVVDVPPDQPGFMIDGSSVDTDSPKLITLLPEELSLQSLPASATIYYTMDNSTPTTSSPVFDASAPINLAGEGVDLIFKAIAFDANTVASPVSTLNVSLRREALTASLTSSTTLATFSWGAVDPYMTPAGIVSDGKNLFVLDSNRKVIWEIDIASGESSILAGSLNERDLVDGTGGNARFWGLNGITTDGTYLYITDRSAVRRVNIATAEVLTLAGRFDSGYIDGAGTDARFSTMLKGITTNGRYLFIVDYKDVASSYIRRVDLYSPSFTVDTIATIIHSCSGITTDGNQLYITAFYYDSVDPSKKRGAIWRSYFDGTGVGTIAGNASAEPGSADGTGTGATFNDPWSLETDGTDLYIFEHGGMHIRRLKISSNVVTTISGTTMEGWTNGIAVDGNSLYYLSKAGYTASLYRHD